MIIQNLFLILFEFLPKIINSTQFSLLSDQRQAYHNGIVVYKWIFSKEGDYHLNIRIFKYYSKMDFSN